LSTDDLDTNALRRILKITRKLSVPIDLDTMLISVIDSARDVLEADRGTVFLYDPASHELHSKVATSAQEIRFSADLGIAGECARTRAMVNVPDCYADSRFNPAIDKKTGYRTRCLLTIPLIGHDDQLVGVLQLLNKREGVFDVRDEQIAEALAAQCAVALQRASFLEDRVLREKLQSDLALARDIQRRVLPESMPELTGYDFAGWSGPAEETGGDIYDAVGMGESRVALLLGDATGHGIGPALSVTQVRAMFRMAVRLSASLDDIFNHVNNQLVDDLAANRFVTAFVGVLDAERHQVRYHAAGQAPLLHFDASTRSCTLLPASTVPMGVMNNPPTKTPSPIDMGPGDVLALITDGLFEHPDPDRAQFGKERTIQLIWELIEQPMTTVVERLLAAVTEFARGAAQDDDMTVLLVKRR
jgi:phosphoserine phosphatase